ncbi:DUF2225 domain-containing protein [Cytobacillus sp. FJAT-54145]|uniref:DUF2225 domain-containing protein n=1 Tax=Cytobacillus spartinae TaxID=3299023 RepID=A0ABW6KDV4_9BACI
MTELTPLFDKKYECLICKKSFTSKKIRSRFIKVIDYDSDFCPNYSSDENNPMLYHVNVCPHCGYSFSDDFNPYFPPSSIEAIKNKVCEQWVPHNFSETRTREDAIKTYKIAVYCGTLKKEKHISIAGLYMRLAWIYRSLKNDQQEIRFLKLAAHEYMESYMADDYRGTQVSDVRILYLIGEVSRRIGNTEQAVKYLSKVIEKQRSTVETKIVEMARESWYEIREAQKVESSMTEAT